VSDVQPVEPIRTVELADDLELHIIEDRIAGHNGENAFKRAQAAFLAGAEPQAFLNRWLSLAGAQTDRYRPTGPRYAGDDYMRHRETLTEVDEVATLPERKETA
jgi:hypothetical protein